MILVDTKVAAQLHLETLLVIITQTTSFDSAILVLKLLESCDDLNMNCYCLHKVLAMKSTIFLLADTPNDATILEVFIWVIF